MGCEDSHTAAIRRVISGASNTQLYCALVQRRLASVWKVVAMHTESNFARSWRTMLRSSCTSQQHRLHHGWHGQQRKRLHCHAQPSPLHASASSSMEETSASSSAASACFRRWSPESALQRSFHCCNACMAMGTGQCAVTKSHLRGEAGGDAPVDADAFWDVAPIGAGALMKAMLAQNPGGPCRHGERPWSGWDACMHAPA